MIASMKEQGDSSHAAVVNGSFVTDIPESNDVDCILLAAADMKPDGSMLADPFVDLPFISKEVVDQAGFDFFVDRFFVTDREKFPKGMIEVMP